MNLITLIDGIGSSGTKKFHPEWNYVSIIWISVNVIPSVDAYHFVLINLEESIPILG